ncbi:hypothetical protein DFH28DRAFT_971024 [Melampsora americana]|nr:hypothetical protein DFH28DRAFT_971024 [Melampsora americana]
MSPVCLQVFSRFQALVLSVFNGFSLPPTNFCLFCSVICSLLLAISLFYPFLLVISWSKDLALSITRASFVFKPPIMCISKVELHNVLSTMILLLLCVFVDVPLMCFQVLYGANLFIASLCLCCCNMVPVWIQN